MYSCLLFLCYKKTVTLFVASEYKLFEENPLTVNSEIFERALVSQNFSYAKFRENKILTKCRNHSRLLIYVNHALVTSF